MLAIEKACFTLLFSGLIMVGVTIGMANSAAVSGALSGFSASLLGVLFLLILQYRNLFVALSFSQILRFLSPYLVLIGLFSFHLYLLSAFFSVIALGHVGSSYVLFQYLSLILQVILVGLFSLGSGATLLSLVIGLLDLFLLITLYISLQYYTTDGFDGIPPWLQGRAGRYDRPKWTHPTFAFPFPPRVMNM